MARFIYVLLFYTLSTKLYLFIYLFYNCISWILGVFRWPTYKQKKWCIHESSRKFISWWWKSNVDSNFPQHFYCTPWRASESCWWKWHKGPYFFIFYFLKLVKVKIKIKMVDFFVLQGLEAALDKAVQLEDDRKTRYVYIYMMKTFIYFSYNYKFITYQLVIY